MSVPWHTRWWLDSKVQAQSQARSGAEVLLLSANDLALVTQLVAALYGKARSIADPQGRIDAADASPPRVAVFIDAYDGSGQPPPWQGHGGDIVYDSPAAYRILGFVSVDP